MNYSVYINGPEWKARRAKHLLTYGKRCEACHRTQDIHVHHRTYERLGSELDTDLAVLCEVCHNQVHQIHDLMPFTSLSAATSLFISSIQDALTTGDTKHHHLPKRRRRR